MAFSSAITQRTIFGNKRVHYGTFTNSVGSGTGGDINTGMHRVEMFTLMPKGTSVWGNHPVVNETFPLTGSAGAMAEVTIVTDAVMDGYWLSIGI